MFQKTVKKARAFHKDENGDILQVAIVMGILAVIAVGGLVFLKPKITDMFNKTGGEIDTAKSQNY
ncbi:MAG: hypothetical protein ACYCX4_03610 [Bacillota bacterium]